MYLLRRGNTETKSASEDKGFWQKQGKMPDQREENLHKEEDFVQRYGQIVRAMSVLGQLQQDKRAVGGSPLREGRKQEKPITWVSAHTGL